MNRQPFYQNYGTSNLTESFQPTYDPKNHWQTTMNNKNTPQFGLNPSASAFHSSQPVSYPPTATYPSTAGFFNLTSISRSRTENPYVIPQRPPQPPPPQKNSTEAFPPTQSQSEKSSSSSSKTNKKPKREYKLEDLQKLLRNCKDDIDYYEKKRKRLSDEINKLNSELKSCDDSLRNHKSKYRCIQSDIEKKKKEMGESISRNSSERSSSSSNQNSLPNHNSTPNNYSPIQASANSINNLSINSNTKQTNAESTFNNVISNLLDKKRKEIEFPKFDFIFDVVEEVYEPKPISVVGSKFDINLTFKKLLSSEDKKAGYRYIIRGCVYDSKSLFQSDNLSFIKSYDFANTNKKHTYENHDTSANKLMFPFDITDYCRLDKKLNITINLNKKMVEEMKIAFGVYYVKRLEFRETLELVKKKELIRKKKSDITKNQVTNSFNQSCGIQMENYKISLIDPLSKSKIQMPCIGETCEHIATFDGLTFLESNSKKFQWFCPICGKPILYDQLYYDELISEILKKVSKDCEMIEFDKDSNWIPLSEMINKPEAVADEDDCITLE